MTAEPDLLPSSVAAFVEALKGERGSLDAWLEVNNEREVAAHVEAYARAVAEHNVKERDAEIEALRAEVSQEQDYAAGAARRVLTAQLAQRRAEARAERMAEALQKLEDSCEDSDCVQYGTLATSFVRGICKDALRDHDQEARNG